MRISPLLLLCLLVTPVTALETEDIFRAAERYTVKIKTTSRHAYIGDEVGVSIGAGFLVDGERGWIISNKHVVSQAPSRVEIKFKDTEYLKASKIYLDPQIDLAILQIPATRLPQQARTATLACHDRPQTGHPVLTFGHPEGLNFTGTRGIISGTTFYSDNEWLQTDAPINPGNSGGPLISVKSTQVVGINSAKVRDDKTENLNLAISIEHACRIIELMKAGRNPAPPRLPVAFIDYDRDAPQLVVAKSNDVDQFPLHSGDRIVGVIDHGNSIDNKEHLFYLLRGITGRIELTVERDDRMVRVPVEIKPAANLLDEKGLAFSGMTVKRLRLTDQPGNPDQHALYVVNVRKGSIAEGFGYKKWDQVYRVNNTQISNLQQMHDILADLVGPEPTADIIVKRISRLDKNYYDYYSQEMPVKDLLELSNPR